jgi:hypothetical protein
VSSSGATTHRRPVDSEGAGWSWAGYRSWRERWRSGPSLPPSLSRNRPTRRGGLIEEPGAAQEALARNPTRSVVLFPAANAMPFSALTTAAASRRSAELPDGVEVADAWDIVVLDGTWCVCDMRPLIERSWLHADCCTYGGGDVN